MPDRSEPGSASTVLPGVVDRHVHLGLVDRGLLADGPVVEVHDLGWAPDVAVGWRAEPPAGVTVRVAGPFHTAPGGYPSGRPWAPATAVREVADVADAEAAVRAAASYGVDLVKVALHAGMPLLPDDVLRALVRAAHDAGLPVAVHAEGAGQVARAVDAGADLLAHAPWTEPVPDDVLRRGRHQTWVSTLAIHGPDDLDTATDNVRRFRAQGGRVVYGTDLGNGPTPVGVSVAEIRALGRCGLEGEELLDAVLGPRAAHLPPERCLTSPHPVPHTAPQLVRWLADARRLPDPRPEEQP